MPRLIDAPLEISFSPFNDEDEISREFHTLSQSDDDPVGQWLKLARARGDTSDSDQVLITLVTELHRKVDELTALIKDEKISYMSLENHLKIDSIGFDNFHLMDGVLEEQRRYYGRIEMPFFPKRVMPMFFVGIDANLAKITLLHERDRDDWNAYITARERIMIRQMRAKNAD